MIISSRGFPPKSLGEQPPVHRMKTIHRMNVYEIIKHRGKLKRITELTDEEFSIVQDLLTTKKLSGEHTWSGYWKEAFGEDFDGDYSHLDIVRKLYPHIGDLSKGSLKDQELFYDGF